MKKLLLILLTIPLVSFAEEPIYFDCNFTCEKNTMYADSKHPDDTALDGCQAPFKVRQGDTRGIRSTFKMKYTYYKSQNKVIAHDKEYKCESDETDMRCSSLRGTRFGNPDRYLYGSRKGQARDTYQVIHYFDISRTTLDAEYTMEWQHDKDSRIIYHIGKGKCEMNKIQF